MRYEEAPHQRARPADQRRTRRRARPPAASERPAVRASAARGIARSPDAASDRWPSHSSRRIQPMCDHQKPRCTGECRSSACRSTCGGGGGALAHQSAPFCASVCASNASTNWNARRSCTRGARSSGGSRRSPAPCARSRRRARARRRRATARSHDARQGGQVDRPEWRVARLEVVRPRPRAATGRSNPTFTIKNGAAPAEATRLAPSRALVSGANQRLT